MSADDHVLSLSPLAGDLPCGANLEYDDLYLKLEELAEGTPDTQMGDSVAEGKDPDFYALRKTCRQLWERTRDLRVACYFTLASLKLEGLQGLRDGIKVIAYLFDELYDGFFPNLDPDDDNDPTERINILALISPVQGSMADTANCCTLLRQIKLCKALPYTYRDYLVLNGTFEAVEQSDLPDMALFEAEMHRAATEDLQESLTCTEEIIEDLNKIADSFNSKIADQGYASFDALLKELKPLAAFYQKALQGRGAPETDEAPAADEAPQEDGSAPAAAAAPVRAPAPARLDLSSVTISTRQEALMLLGKCSDYFVKAEPNSPLPFLIKRALRMADMNFIELLGEIDSSAQDRGREQLGVKEEN